ncbi:MAG TPA: ABC transporter permease [Bryobacteraceae bacterium]|nr:ABC transporter permease [Bryobacteraceae bacterium]
MNRFAIRNLRKNSTYALTAIFLLALGIGGNIAIFSIVNAVFLRPLPYPDAGRLMWATEYFPKFKRTQIFAPEYAAWRAQAKSFERLEAYGINAGVNLAGKNRSAQRVQDENVTPGFFDMLRVHPHLGRTFMQEEEQAQSSQVIVISDVLWRNYFQSDPDILGKSVSLDGAPAAVIGVMPPGFQDPVSPNTGIWLPNAMKPEMAVPGRRMSYLGGVIGRLKEGVTAEEARANLTVIARQMDSHYPTPWSGYHAAASVRVLPLQDQLTKQARTGIYVLMGAAGFILLIVCANLANMFLSRGIARRRELAIRAAMGASRLQIVRLLLSESLLLSVCGGLTGLLLMRWGISALYFLIPNAIPHHVPVDVRVLAFAIFCCLATSAIFGLLPALTVSKLDLNTALKESRAVAAPRRGSFSFRTVLAVAQLALSVVLLAGAGLLLRSFVSLLNVNPGFNSHNVLTAEISLAPRDLYGPVQQAEFFHRLLDAAKQIPGVTSASVTDESPLATFQSLASGLAAEGGPPSDAVVVPTSISADYFKTLQTRLLSGRFFNKSDGSGSPRVVVINQTLAGILFPNRNPVGRRIKFGGDADPWVTVVGVVAGIHHRGLGDRNWPEIFQPYEQAPAYWMTLLVKTSGDPLSLAPALRKTIASIDRKQPLFAIQSLDQRLSDSVAQPRQRAFLLGLFALTALLIAATGVYGVVAYSVALRTHEMGIRMALGATKPDILLMVMSEGLRMSLVGLLLGIAGALALTRLIASFLFGVSSTDVTTFVSVCAVLLTAAGAAVWIPARRAIKVDPAVALRQE